MFHAANVDQLWLKIRDLLCHCLFYQAGLKKTNDKSPQN